VFPAQLVPSLNVRGISRNAALLATGDLDGDGVDEALVAAPATGGSGDSSALFFARVQTSSTQVTVEPTGTLVRLPFLVTQEGQFELVDVDGDGALDVVLLAGTVQTDRQLVIAWNKSGVFSSDDVVTVNDTNEAPEGFTLVRDQAVAAPAIAYVTHDAVMLAHLTNRTVSDRNKLLSSTNPSGIVAADVDGDGVQDLAVAQDTNIVLLRGQAVLP
jgi:hypothetical protein